MGKVKIALSLTAVLGLMATDALAVNCAPTRSDSLGPFYVSGMPITDSLLRSPARKGEPLIVIGQVLSAIPPHSPVKGARLEAWQTDGEGDYHPADNGPASRYQDNELDLRGTVVADESGEYQYSTLNPGAYYPRPKHIHYVITAPGFKRLVTQHYLGDAGQLPSVPCRSGTIDRSTGRAVFNAPPIYLETN